MSCKNIDANAQCNEQFTYECYTRNFYGFSVKSFARQ